MNAKSIATNAAAFGLFGTLLVGTAASAGTQPNMHQVQPVQDQQVLSHAQPSRAPYLQEADIVVDVPTPPVVWVPQPPVIWVPFPRSSAS